jgi:polyketide cyclase/dehydrase/lipid transport protein
MRLRRRERDTMEAPGAAAGRASRRVTARTLIAASRERVWARIHRDDASLLSLAFDFASWRSINASAPVRALRALGLTIEDQVVASVALQHYAYQFVCPALFRVHTGQILLREYRRTTTEVIWTVDFEPALPGTGWVALAVLDRLVDMALLRLKQTLETKACVAR